MIIYLAGFVHSLNAILLGFSGNERDRRWLEFLDHGAGPAASMDISHPAFEATRGALSQEWPAEATFIGMGGSIPVAGYFKTELGMDSMLTGFARDDDAIHSPNEKYDLECFHRGIRSWARILAAIA